MTFSISFCRELSIKNDVVLEELSEPLMWSFACGDVVPIPRFEPKPVGFM